MDVKPLTVGPIVGETTPKRVRIWGRGDTQVIDGAPRRCFGVIRWKEYGATKYLKYRYFKMNPNFDMTGIAVIESLKPKTYYEYEVGYFYSDVELSDATANDVGWEDASYGYFKTASDSKSDARTIVIGSCRYPVSYTHLTLPTNREV